MLKLLDNINTQYDNRVSENVIKNETLLFFKLSGINLTLEEIMYPPFFKEAVSMMISDDVAVLHLSKISILITLMQQKDSVIPVAMLLAKYMQKLYSSLSMNKILIPNSSSEIEDEVTKICR